MVKLRLALFGLAAAFVLPVSARAQLTLTGRVTDERGQALVGTQVVVRGTGIGALSGQDGRYRLVLPRPGAQTVVEASYLGYSSKTAATARTSGARSSPAATRTRRPVAGVKGTPTTSFG